MEQEGGFAAPKLGVLVNNDGEKHKHGHVTFDEATIAEHDKLRGTRQKIDEPDTPFHRESFDSVEDAEHPSYLEEGAGVVMFNDEKEAKPAEKQDAPKQGGFDFAALQAKLEDQQDMEPTAAKESAKKDFDQKRKQHYNEFQMMQKWKQEHANDENDDDEDE